METRMAKDIGRAKLVKKERDARAWTQTQLAQVAGINLRTVQRLEKDGSASFETLMGIAQAFGIDVKQLNPLSKRQQKADSQKKVHLMPRLTSGKDLVHIVSGADQFQVEHDEADDKRAIGAMVDILNLLKRDMVRWHDSDLAGKLQIEFELSQEIMGLERHGFYFFGVKRSIPRIVDDEKTHINMCTIYMSHAGSRKIVRDKNCNMMIPAVLAEVAQ